MLYLNLFRCIICYEIKDGAELKEVCTSMEITNNLFTDKEEDRFKLI